MARGNGWPMDIVDRTHTYAILYVAKKGAYAPTRTTYPLEAVYECIGECSFMAS
jgi:hypothetical protein